MKLPTNYYNINSKLMIQILLNYGTIDIEATLLPQVAVISESLRESPM